MNALKDYRMTSFITPESLVHAHGIKKNGSNRVITKRRIQCGMIRGGAIRQQSSPLIFSPSMNDDELNDNNEDHDGDDCMETSQFFGAQVPLEQLHQEIIGFKPLSSIDKIVHYDESSIQCDSRLTFKRVKFSSPPLTGLLNIEDEIEKEIKNTLDDKIEFKYSSSFDPPPLSVLNDHSIQIRKKRRSDDLYTPRWIRGYGNGREGLCELCNPGQWFRTKQSSYWYHMNFHHGISASTGRPYDSPDHLRESLSKFISSSSSTSILTHHYSSSSSSSDNCNIVEVEGHCKNCQQWIPLGKKMINNGSDGGGILETISDKKKFSNMNQWYRHCQKCQPKGYLSGR